MAADKQRGRQTVRDMVLSLAVILVAAWMAYLFIPHDEHQDPVKTVSYRVELDSARRAAPYPVLAPKGLPPRWRATSVRYSPSGRQGAAWHLGFITPGDEYAAVEQSDTANTRLYLREVTQGAHRTARTERIGGQEWVRYEGPKYDALVRQVPGPPAASRAAARTPGRTDGPAVRHTTVVTGTASFARLEELAQALSGAPGSGGQGGGASASPSATSTRS